jgi:hypothetical protein
MLGIGEREGEIEVLDIDEKAGIVKVNDYGVITNVPFAKVPTTPSAPVTAAAIPAPGGNPAFNPSIPQRTIPGLPTRQVRLGNGNQGGLTPGNPVSPGLTGYSPSTTAQGNRPEVPISGDAEIIMMEAQREHFKSRGDPTAGLLPPTELTSPDDLRTLVTPGSRLPRGFQQPAPQPQ